MRATIKNKDLKNINPTTARQLVINSIKGIFSACCIQAGINPVFDCVPYSEGIDEDVLLFADSTYMADLFLRDRSKGGSALLSQYFLFCIDKREMYNDFGTL